MVLTSQQYETSAWLIKKMSTILWALFVIVSLVNMSPFVKDLIDFSIDYIIFKYFIRYLL